jgi:hypothetical protein
MKVGRLAPSGEMDKKNARVLEMRSWWAAAMNREEWRKLLKDAKTLYQ